MSWTLANPAAWLTAFPPDPLRAGTVLLFAEVFGVNEHIADVARHFGALGQNVVVVNLRHRETHMKVDYADDPAAMTWALQQSEQSIFTDVKACIDMVRTLGIASELTSVGLRFGGRLAALAAAHFPESINRVIAIYPNGLLGEPRLPNLGVSLSERMHGLRAAMYFIFAEQDPYVSHDEVEKIGTLLTLAGVPHRIEVVPARDKFLNAWHSNYRPALAISTWRSIESFLRASSHQSGSVTEHSHQKERPR